MNITDRREGGNSSLDMKVVTVGSTHSTWALDHLLSHFNAIAFCVPHVVNKKGEVF